MTKTLRLVPLTILLLSNLSAPAAAAPITPVTYTFTGTLSSVSSAMDFLMPGLAAGTSFLGTMALNPYDGNEALSTADLYIVAGAQIVMARSIGLDPLSDFASFTPTGVLSSPTIQNGYVDNVFFKLENGGASLGQLALFVMGTADSLGRGTVTGGNAWGEIYSVTTVPEPATGALSLLGLALCALRRRAHKRRSAERHSV